MIYLIRHGQASFGAADYDQLSAIGQRQAALLGEWLGRIGLSVDLIALGGMKRHRQTAEACLGPDRLDGWWVDPGFDEFDHVEVLRRHRPELKDGEALAHFLASQAQPQRAFQELFAQAVARWRAGGHDGEYRESWPAFQARCLKAFAQVSERAGSARTVCVFTSGGPISVICQRLLGIPEDRAFDLNWTLLNTGVSKVVFRPRSLPTLHGLNAVAHLELAGDPGLFTYR